ncbi:MAG: hypothetical protein JKY16_05580 [Lutibacter sp.]|nr:hypothetical protein [Lutibacter sp.]
MNTKILMTISFLFLGSIGIILSFLPKEIILFLNIDPNPVTLIIFQLLGSFYLGFGILNWMAKGTLIGGIYNKPIVIGNLMHFGVGAITLVKVVFTFKEQVAFIILLTIPYIIFALCFAYIFMTNPKKLDSN